jgi:chromosome partitioning protein
MGNGGSVSRKRGEYHIVEGTKPQLAFDANGGKSYPRTDFLQLAEYLEEHTIIDELRQQEP